VFSLHTNFAGDDPYIEKERYMTSHTMPHLQSVQGGVSEPRTQLMTKEVLFREYLKASVKQFDVSQRLVKLTRGSSRYLELSQRREALQRNLTTLKRAADAQGWGDELLSNVSKTFKQHKHAAKRAAPVNLYSQVHGTRDSLRNKYRKKAEEHKQARAKKQKDMEHVAGEEANVLSRVEASSNGPGMMNGMMSDMSRNVNNSPIRVNSMPVGVGRDGVEILDHLFAAVLSVGAAYVGTKVSAGHTFFAPEY